MSHNPYSFSQLSDSPRVYRLPALDGMVTGSTLMFTTESDKGKFIINSIKYVNKSLVGIPTITIAALNVGWTSTNYDDLKSGQVIDSSNTIDMVYTISSSNYLSIPENTDVYVNVVTAVTDSTSFTFDVYVDGYYEDAGIIIPI